MQAPGEAAAPRRKGRGSPLQLLLFAIAVLAVAGVAIAMLGRATHGNKSLPPASVVPPADRNAPAALVRAANAVRFSPNTEPGVGVIESEPASAARTATNSDLLPVGVTAPPFTLRTPTGKSVSLRQLRGKAVLLEFFATWCPHCAAEAPHLAKLARRLPQAGYAVVAVNADSEDAASVFAFHRYFGLPFAAVLDPGGTAGTYHQPGTPGRVSRLYHVKGFPTFYVLDPHGRVAWRSDGEQPDALLLDQLRLAQRHG